jgi:hypothetical protein
MFVDYGATLEQWLAIKRSGANRANGSRSDEDEWFAIWDILFPGRAHPLTPHALYPEVVQFMQDAFRMFTEQGHLDAIADHTLPESSPPGTRALLLGNMTYYYEIYINWVGQLENAARQAGPLTQVQMPLLSLPSLPAPNPDDNYNSAGSNTGNPHVVPPQSLPLRGSLAPLGWPTFADAGPHADPAPLQANPHGSVDANAGPGGADVIDEDYLYLPRAP